MVSQGPLISELIELYTLSIHSFFFFWQSYLNKMVSKTKNKQLSLPDSLPPAPFLGKGSWAWRSVQNPRIPLCFLHPLACSPCFGDKSAKPGSHQIKPHVFLSLQQKGMWGSGVLLHPTGSGPQGMLDGPTLP